MPTLTAGDARQVTGYADRRSAACGDVVAVALSGPPGAVQLAAYRVGAYGTAGARLVWTSPSVPVRYRSGAETDPGTNMLHVSWPVTLRITVTEQWTPGFYLLVPRMGRLSVGPAIPLVVRDDVSEAAIQFTASVLTWNAYNDWGGRSLYRGPGRTSSAGFLSRSRVASFSRPLSGGGYGQMVFMDLPVVRLLEGVAARTGLDVAYTTDIDADQQPSQWLRHAELVFGGHSEYWTTRMYDALAAAWGQGISIVFLGANNLWWHARLATSPGAPQPDQEIVYRVRDGDPTPPASPGDFTLRWPERPERRDPATLLGHSHSAISVHGGYQLLAAPGWMLDGTGLSSGTSEQPGSVLPGAVGNEADGYLAEAYNPPTLTVVAVGVLLGAGGPKPVSASYYVAPTGAAVFSAGTTDWACGIEGPCADQRVPAATARALHRMTENIVVELAAVGAGRTHPSEPSVPPPSAVMRARLAPAAMGTYGGGSGS